MKIHHKGIPVMNRPIQVTCLDELMIEMLMCAPPPYTVYTNEFGLKKARLNNGAYIYKFISGADLCCTNVKNEYEIYHNVYNGNAAVAELKMLDSLRIAKKHFNEMVELNQIIKHLSLKSTLVPI